MLQSRLTLSGETIQVRVEDGDAEHMPPLEWFDIQNEISDFAGLSARQWSFFFEMCMGKSDREIAEYHGVSLQCARETLLCIERKIRKAYDREQRAHNRACNQVLACLRNRLIQDWEVGEADPPAQRWSAAPGYQAARRLSAEDLVADFTSFVALLFKRLAVAAAA